MADYGSSAAFDKCGQTAWARQDRKEGRRFPGKRQERRKATQGWRKKFSRERRIHGKNKKSCRNKKSGCKNNRFTQKIRQIFKSSFLGFKHFHILFKRYGLAVIVSLDFVTAGSTQKVDLLLVLGTFGKSLVQVKHYTL